MAADIETRVVLNTEIADFLNSVLSHASLPRSLRTKIRVALIREGDDVEHSFPYDVLKEAHDHYYDFQRDSTDEILLHELVARTKLFNVAVPEPERSPELIKRLAKLKASQEQREYDSMVKNVRTIKSVAGAEIGQAVRSTGKQLMSVTNFLLSVGATAAFGFVSSQYAFSEDLGLRIIFSVILATVVAIAELYFMARVEI